MKYLGNVFGHSLGRVWMSRSRSPGSNFLPIENALHALVAAGGGSCAWGLCLVKRLVLVSSLCTKYLGNRWTDMRQIHTEDVFCPSLGQIWGRRSISAACVLFMFGKTFLLCLFYNNERNDGVLAWLSVIVWSKVQMICTWLVQLMSLPPHHFLLHQNPHSYNLSGDGLHRLS